MLIAATSFAGIELRVIPTWVSDWRYVTLRPGRVPPKARRKVTRRQWKRAHPSGLRWRYGPVEPAHVLQAGGVIYCTARQAAWLKQRCAG